MAMRAKTVEVPRAATASVTLEALLRQYGGTIELTGDDDSFYERHLLFDNVVDPAATGSAGALVNPARILRSPV